MRVRPDREKTFPTVLTGIREVSIKSEVMETDPRSGHVLLRSSETKTTFVVDLEVPFTRERTILVRVCKSSHSEGKRSKLGEGGIDLSERMSTGGGRRRAAPKVPVLVPSTCGPAGPIGPTVVPNGCGLSRV